MRNERPCYSLTSVVPGELTIEPVTDPSTLTVRARSSRGNVYDGTVKSVAGFETLEFVVNGGEMRNEK